MVLFVIMAIIPDIKNAMTIEFIMLKNAKHKKIISIYRPKGNLVIAHIFYAYTKTQFSCSSFILVSIDYTKPRDAIP